MCWRSWTDASSRVIAGLVLGLGAGCGSPVPWDSDGGRVVIVGVEQLRAPDIPQAGVYSPAYFFEHGSADDSDGKSAGFFVSLAALELADLGLRLVERDNGGVVELRRIAAPPAASLAEGAWSAAGELGERLRAGDAVYWLAGEQPGAPGTHRVGVAIPQARLRSFVLLEAFRIISQDGAAIAADHIELVPGFFYMAAVGDSVMWGNGLRPQDKFTTLIAEHLEQRLHLKVIQRVHALSGARIAPNEAPDCVGPCRGEVPKSPVSVTRQVELLESPERLDLLLVDGCANDVGLERLLSPEISAAEIQALTQKHCYQGMRELLELVGTRAPQAHVVVTGYFQFVSSESMLAGLEQWLGSLNIPILGRVDVRKLLAGLTHNAEMFDQTSAAALAAAVDEFNAGGSARAVFVEPGYGPQNATFATEPWLWGLSADALLDGAGAALGLELVPEDPMVELRLQACFEAADLLGGLPCLYASVGHPNPAGARAYADAVIAALDELGVLAARP